MSQEPANPAGRIREIGNCEILGKVGQGGMGTVFRARQVSLDRVVALKVLPPSIAKDATFIDRFQREARAAAKLSHPNIVNGIDVGQDAATGLWYFVMEFVDGPTLNQVLKERKRIPEDEALKIAKQMAGALDCLAAHNMVHRDIKPDNILMTTRGEAKLADLGLAKDIKDDASLTQSGRAVGTPYYMSPEQVRGEVADVDIRTDIYALGGTLYHLVTGKPPFSGETSAVIMSKHLTEVPVLANKIAADVSEGCARLIARMMQKKKEDRIQTPRELMDAIDKVLSGEYLTTTGPRAAIRTTGPRQPVSGTRGTGKHAPTKKLPLVPIAAAAALIIGGGAFFALSGKKETPAVANKADAPSGSTKTDAPASGTTAASSAAGSTSKTPAPVVAAPAMGLFESAKKFADENPDAHDEIAKRFKEVAQKAAKAPDAAAVNAAIEKTLQELDEKRGAVVDAEWKKIEALATVAANGGDIDGAVQISAKLPEGLADLLKERSDELTARITADAEKKIDAAVKLAEDASARAEPQAGLDALAGVEGMQFAAHAEKIKALKTRLAQEAENVVALKRKKDELEANSRLAVYLERFEKALLEEKNLEQARGIAAEAVKDTALEMIAPAAKALEEIVAVHADYQKRTLDALDYHKGKQVKINKDEGILRDTKDGVISLEIRSPGAGAGTFGIKKIKLADLSEAQRKDLFKVEWAETPVAKVAAAMPKLRAGPGEDLASAAELLAGGTACPLHAAYDEKLQIRLRGAVEVAAEKAFAELEAAAGAGLDTQAAGYALLEKVGAYLKAHGETKFSAVKQADLDAIRAKATKAAIVNLVADGDFESGEPGQWKGKGAGDYDVTADTAHSGKRSYKMMEAGRAWRMVTVEPGMKYKLTAFVTGMGANHVICRVQEGNDTIAGAVQAVKFAAGEPQAGRVWKPVEIHFVPKTASVMVQFEKEVGDGRSHFDDVVVTRVLGDESAVAAAVGPSQPVIKPWPLQIRACADGQKTELHSSLALGENYTGSMRSAHFAAPKSLSFYLSGHYGAPGSETPVKNLVRLHDAVTREVLTYAAVPRSDTAVRVTWDLEKWLGKQVYVEFVDGDDGGEYAWLAAGRFEPPIVLAGATQPLQPPLAMKAMPPAAVPAAAATNLIPNGGFELGTDPWRLVRATLQSDGGAHGGRNYMLVQVKGGISTMLKTDPGHTYHVSCWVHGRGYLYMQVDKADNGYAYAEEDKGWVLAKFKFTASASSHLIEFAPRAANYYIDDVTVVRGELDPAKAAQGQIHLLPEFHYHNGHVYRIFKETVSWAEAKAACEKMGGHLATVEDAEENLFLSKLATASGRDVWIGLFDPRGQNAWEWVDGTKMKFSSFSPRGLNPKRQIARAARYAQFVAYDWAEDPIEKLYFFACEWDSVPEKLLAKKPAGGGATPGANPNPSPERK